MIQRRFECVFVDDVDNADVEQVHFVDGKRNRIMLQSPGAAADLCICVTAYAHASDPLAKLALSFSAFGEEIDWITFEKAAVQPPPGCLDIPYQVDHIFCVPAYLTFHECSLLVKATTEREHLGIEELSIEFPAPF